jgi:hypothetical protein
LGDCLKWRIGFFITRALLGLLLFGFSIKSASCFETPNEDELRFSTGLQYQNFNYSEPNVMTEKGSLFGPTFQMIFASESLRLFYFEADINILGGGIVYDGATQSGRPIQQVGVDYLIAGGLKAGSLISLSDTVIIRPFLGFMTRYWNDKILGSSGFVREITYFYLPLGIFGEVDFRNDLKIGMSFQENLFLFGTALSHLELIGGSETGLSTAINRQSDGTGYEAALHAEFRVEGKVLSVSPYYQFWHINESLPYRLVGNLSVIEPENFTKAFGLKLSLKY